MVLAQALASSAATRPSGRQLQRGGSTARPSQPRRAVLTQAKEGSRDKTPPDVPKPRDQPRGGKEWLQSILSRFGPVKEKAANTTVLDFEKPLVELDNRIKEVGGAGAAALAAAARGGAGGAGRAGGRRVVRH